MRCGDGGLDEDGGVGVSTSACKRPEPSRGVALLTDGAFFRPFLAHFASFFPHFFAVPSIWPARFQKPAPRPRKTVRNGRETAAKRGSKTVCCSHTLQPSTMAFAKCFRHPCKAAPRCTREPQPCPAHARRTFCMSDPSPGQCDSPARSGACPPCPVEVRKPRPCIVASVKSRSRSPGPSENGAEMHGWCQDPTSWPHSARDQNNTVAVSAATVGLGCACCRDSS